MNKLLCETLLSSEDPGVLARAIGEVAGCLAVAARDTGLLAVVHGEAMRVVAVMGREQRP